MDSPRKLEVLIPDGESEFALFAAHCMTAFENVRLHVLSSERWAPIRFSRHCASYTFRPASEDTVGQFEAIAEVVEKQHIDVLLPTETSSISWAVANRTALSEIVAVVPLPDPASFEIANNKWLLAQFLTEHQIPCPTTVLATYDDAFEAAVRELEFPVLLKPVSAWGGEGIERFERLDQLDRKSTRLNSSHYS